MIDTKVFNERYGLHVKEHSNYCKDNKCHFYKLQIATNSYYMSYIKLHQLSCINIDCCVYLMLEKTISELLGKDINLVNK